MPKLTVKFGGRGSSLENQAYGRVGRQAIKIGIERIYRTEFAPVDAYYEVRDQRIGRCGFFARFVPVDDEVMAR
ncbi:MAG: hypothetical protein CFE26_24275, partial [Verrucomicrobiales bacterium VVV1]